MATYAEILTKAAEHPEMLADDDFAELRRVCREYPADAAAPSVLLKFGAAGMSEKEIAFARARVALYCGAPEVLISAIDPSGKGFNNFYPPLPVNNRPSTEGAIDLFLERYGHQSPEEDALLERMIFNPVPDFAEQLARETTLPQEQAPAGSQSALIDAFLARHNEENTTAPTTKPSSQVADTEEKAETTAPQLPTDTPKPIASPPTPTEPNTHSKPPTSSLLSESLAKIFIKQGRYERAFEIISNLNLNYPEKSVYFADQLRFLEKLIINQRFNPANSHEND